MDETIENNMGYDDSNGPTDLESEEIEFVLLRCIRLVIKELSAFTDAGFKMPVIADHPSKAAIYGRMADIMAEIGSIAKGQKNKAQGFSYRGIDDIYNALHAICARHRVFCLPAVLSVERTEKVSKSGSALSFVTVRMIYHFVADDGSRLSVEMVGEGMDSGDKATSKAVSIAQKYALLQTFLIPTEDAKDPDADSYEVSATKADPDADSYEVSATKAAPQDQAKIKSLIQHSNTNSENFFGWLGKEEHELTPDDAKRAIAALTKKLKMQGE